jgi:hypothetical protein
MATNTFRPTALRTGVSTNMAATALVPTPDTGSSIQNQQTVYEWYDFSSQWKHNPPFLKGSAGSLVEGLRVSGGEERPRILRGFIRRAQYSLNDDASMSRLYFMYNPESISRDYLNYLDQGALDPFNTVFQSGNLVAPPSMLNFSFELFFDRQEEAMAAGNRGVMVDMDYFDLVVRNVKPGGTATNATLPDNGVMMVNPRDITVVFSPEITVQGRPLNASVTYERFTHKMVPTRVRINLQMRVVYFGPMREITTFVPETVRALESIPFISDPDRYEFDYSKPLTFEGTNEAEGSDSSDPNEEDTRPAPDSFDTAELKDVEIPIGPEREDVMLNIEAMEHGYQRALEFDTQYNNDRYTELWRFADCSSFVWASYAEIGLSEALTWHKWKDGASSQPAINNTQNIYDKFAANDAIGRKLWGWGGSSVAPEDRVQKIRDTCASGDLLIRVDSGRTDHIGFVWKIWPNKVEVLHASDPNNDVTISTYSADSKPTFDHAVRPLFPHLITHL